MTAEQNTTLNTLTGALGVKSKAALALYSPAEIYRRVQDAKQECDWSELQQLHAEAKKEYDDLQILEKSILTRASPLLPKAIRLGLKHPGVSLQDYEEWFGGRAAYYASPGEVSSMFSPAAYLAEMYREARLLYPTGTQFHIDQRRPDLAGLVLSQSNMDTEVSALSLSNEVLLARVRATRAWEGAATAGSGEGAGGLHAEEGAEEGDIDDAALKKLSTHVHSSGTPYHHHHARLRQVQKYQDPGFRQLMKAPRVTGHLSGASLASIYYDIPPALYDILTEEIPSDQKALEELYAKYFTLSVEEMMKPWALRSYFGLTDEEVRAFVGGGEYGEGAEYVDNVLTCWVGDRIMRLQMGSSSHKGYYNYVRLYPLGNNKWRLTFNKKTSAHEKIIVGSSNTPTTPPGMIRKTLLASDYQIEKFIEGEEYSTEVEWPYDMVTQEFSLAMETLSWYPEKGKWAGWNVVYRYTSQVLPNHAFILKLNKAIRLYKATGLSPRVLEDIVNSVNPNQITDETLTLLFRTQLLMQRYGVSHEEALVMARGNISLTAHGAELSQWDRLFNLPALVDGGFYPSSKQITFHPDRAGDDADIKAVLKRAFQVDDVGMYYLKLIQHDESEGATPYTNMSQENVSVLYALSLWARLHGLVARELYQLLRLIGLPERLVDASSSDWNALLDRLFITVQWLKERNGTVHDLVLMTRSFGGDTLPGAEIRNLLVPIRELVQENRGAEPSRHIALLAPLISGVLGLNSDTAAVALLNWMDAAKPGGLDIAWLWKHFTAQKVSTDIPAALLFGYSLAQTALIYHATGLTPDGLALFVKKPAVFGGSAVLPCTVPVIMALADFSAWLKTLPESGAVVGLLSGSGLNKSALVQATGHGETLITQALAAAKKWKDVSDASRVTSWAEISVVLQWLDLANAFGVTPATVDRMLTLDYCREDSNDGDWDIWRQVANAFSAGLPPAGVQAVTSATGPMLSAALSGYLTSMREGIASSREGLFEYLLADNLNGPQVKTSRLAEALTSLQTFLHRTLASPEDTGCLVRASLDRQFFRDWTQWNSRYSTWAAGKKLMYYPENYIDPTVRLGQTAMMDEMLQVLGQAQINTDTVGDAFMGYLTGFEEVANLETIGAYHDSEDTSAGKIWMLGCNQSTPREYWWRSVDMGKRATNGTLPANAWTGWAKITTTPQPFGNLIRPVVYRGRLYLGWVERNKNVLERNEKGEETMWAYRWELKVAWLRYDGGWSMPAVYEYPPEIVETLEGKTWLGATPPTPLSFYLSTWPTQQSMVSGVYRTNETNMDSFIAGVNIFEDMTFSASNVGPANWDELKQFMDTTAEGKVVQPFKAKAPSVENRLTGQTALPAGFTRFDASALNVSIFDVNEEGTEYRIRMGLTQTVDMVRPEREDAGLRSLVKAYHELAEDDSTCAIVVSGEILGSKNSLFVRNENGVNWAYIFIKSSVSITHVADGSTPDKKAALQSADGGRVARFQLDTAGDLPFDYAFAFWLGEDGYRVFALYEVISRPEFGVATPSKYVGSAPGVIPAAQITSQISGGGGDVSRFRVSSRSLDLSTGAASYAWANNSYPVAAGKKFTFSGNEVIHQVTLTCGTGKSCTWNLRVYKANSTLQVDVIGSEVTDGARAQYLAHGKNKARTRLNTLFARQLTEKAVNGIDAILNYDTQMLPEPPLKAGDGDLMMDFSGANAIYFWELFYYTPMMVMQRFLQEERYDLAEKWLKYIFSPTGYIVQGASLARMWNVRPLEEDTSWNDEPLKSYDPDAVAQNDPMHYKLNTFMRLLDITIGKGDAAYRKLERDTLVEAKVWYGSALRLLGEKTWIEPGAGWGDPTLLSASAQQRLTARFDALSMMAQGIRHSKDIPLAADAAAPLFLPEANDQMLGYWEALRIRLYNLRHNLTIDGQPMSLPLYAPPADPKALLAAAVAAEGGAGSELPLVTDIPALRFTPMLESARSMASQLIQFGGSMQQILLSQDAEALAELLTTQGAEIAASSVSLQKQTLEELAAERITLEKSLEATTTRRNHYLALYQEDVNAREIHAMNLLTTSQTTAAAAKGLYVAGAASGLAPNIFGFANGGMKYEGPLYAAGQGIIIAADALSVAGTRIQQEEQYRRRREEWDIQYRLAEKEMAVIEAQLAALSVRETSAQMQIAHMETQSAHAKAQLALFQSKFTGKAMYSWLRGRLATIFYQYYDLTASLCLMAQKSLQYETGDVTKSWLKTGTWNGAWAGLMSGEGLMQNLAQMEVAWMKHQKRELEVTRTVSLAAFLQGRLKEGDKPLTFREAIAKLLEADVDTTVGEGMNKVTLTKDATDKTFSLEIHFSLADLNVAADYAQRDSSPRIRSLAVSLPALLGPYQNVQARLRTNVADNLLPVGCNECAISHAMQDNGLFAPDGTGDARWGARWLPFEGLNVNDPSGMMLSFADAKGDQLSLLESLNDAIVHIQFTVR